MLPIVEPSRRLLFVLFSAFIFVLPLGWENILAGFQSQFDFLLIFTFLALVAFARADAFSPVWLAACGVSVAGYLSMASGALSLFVVAGLNALQIISRIRARSVREFAGIVVLIVLGALMFWTIPIDPNNEWKARSPGQFFGALAQLGSLPFSSIRPQDGVLGMLFGLVFVHFPLVWLMFKILLERPARHSRAWFLFGLAGWIVAQAASLAYGRAVGVTATRYLDLIIIAFPLNLIALLYLLDTLKTPFQHLLGTFAILWLVVTPGALFVLSYSASWPAIVANGERGDAQEQHVLAYLKTGDIANLVDKPHLHVPYDRPTRLAVLLSDPIIRALLPGTLRPVDGDIEAIRARTVFRGAVSGLVARAKNAALTRAYMLLGIGIGLAFLAGFVGFSPLRHGTG